MRYQIIASGDPCIGQPLNLVTMRGATPVTRLLNVNGTDVQCNRLRTYKYLTNTRLQPILWLAK